MGRRQGIVCRGRPALTLYVSPQAPVVKRSSRARGSVSRRREDQGPSGQLQDPPLHGDDTPPQGWRAQAQGLDRRDHGRGKVAERRWADDRRDRSQARATTVDGADKIGQDLVHRVIHHH